MASISSAQLDDLVDTLVRRVRSQMGSGAMPTSTTFDVQYGRGWDSNVTVVAPQVIHAAGRADSRIARRIDHTMLKPEVTHEDLVRLCDEAKQYNFFSVCVNSSRVALCNELLAGSSTVVI